MVKFVISIPEEEIGKMVDAVDDIGDNFINVQTTNLLVNSAFLYEGSDFKKFDFEKSAYAMISSKRAVDSHN